MPTEFGLDAAWGAVFVGGWLSLMLFLGIGFAAWTSRRRNNDPSDLTVLFQADTAQFPREYSSRHRAPRSWPRTVQHRRPVCRRRVPADQRDTVRVRIYDPPEPNSGGGQ